MKTVTTTLVLEYLEGTMLNTYLSARPKRVRICSRCFIIGVFIINVFVIAMAVFSIMENLALHKKRAAQETQNLALALESELNATIDLADSSLRSVIDEYLRQNQAGEIDFLSMKRFIARQQHRNPQIDAVRITDHLGQIILGSDINATTDVNLADRHHFKKLVNAGGDPLILSRLQKSRVNGKWVLVLARRVINREGEFAGMAFIPVTVGYLTNTLTRIRMHEDGEISLRGGDRGLIARHPPLKRFSDYIGQIQVPDKLDQLLERGAQEGTYLAASPIDNIIRLNSFRKVADHDLYLTVGIAKSQYLKTWRNGREAAIIVLSVFFVFTFALSIVAYSYSHRLAQSNKALDQLASTDFLTQLPNRRSFLGKAEEELIRVRRYSNPLSLFMLDIDHFKKINDSYGHDIGDRVLQEIAKIVQGSIRSVDVVARWGGEEFIALLPDSTYTGAKELAERTRQAVERAKINVGTAEPILITISIGIAVLGDKDDTINKLIVRADKQLYLAKNSGRNCVS